MSLWLTVVACWIKEGEFVQVQCQLLSGFGTGTEQQLASFEPANGFFFIQEFSDFNKRSALHNKGINGEMSTHWPHPNGNPVEHSCSCAVFDYRPHERSPVPLCLSIQSLSLSFQGGWFPHWWHPSAGVFWAFRNNCPIRGIHFLKGGQSGYWKCLHSHSGFSKESTLMFIFLKNAFIEL